METEQNTQTQETKKVVNKTMILVGAVALGVVVILAGLFLITNLNQPSQTPSAEMTTTTPTPSPTANTSEDVQASEIITVEGGNYYYKPNEITVKAGQKVTIEFSAKGMMHDFVIDELGVKTPVIQAGKTATVEFTPMQPGEYTFYCSVGDHRAKGMEGTLIVE